MEGLKMASSFHPLLFSGCPGPHFFSSITSVFSRSGILFKEGIFEFCL